MNEAIDVMLHRRSVRSYMGEPIQEAALNTILQAGCAAPHGGPQEPWRLLVLRAKETKQRLLEALKRGIDHAYGGPRDQYWCTFFVNAPVVVAVLVKPTSMGEYPDRVEYGIGVASAACAIQNMLLASAALGLGACWVGPLSEAKEEFESIPGVEPPWEFLALIPIGKPAEGSRRDEPKPIGEIVRFLD